MRVLQVQVIAVHRVQRAPSPFDVQQWSRTSLQCRQAALILPTAWKGTTPLCVSGVRYMTHHEQGCILRGQ